MSGRSTNSIGIWMQRGIGKTRLDMGGQVYRSTWCTRVRFQKRPSKEGLLQCSQRCNKGSQPICWNMYKTSVQGWEVFQPIHDFWVIEAMTACISQSFHFQFSSHSVEKAYCISEPIKFSHFSIDNLFIKVFSEHRCWLASFQNCLLDIGV